MKVISQLLLLLAIVPFLALAKNPDARFLKKPKAPKAPKAAPAPKKSPKATQSPTSSPTTSVPTGTPTTPQLTQIFFSKGSTSLEAYVEAQNDDSQGKLAQFYLDLGLIKGRSSKTETIELLQTSFTTSIDFDLEVDDDDVDSQFRAQVFLEILAYAGGCDSAAACEAAGVTPTPLIPEKVEMNGWYREIDYEANEDALDDFNWQDCMTSTNEAQFLLAGMGSGDFFLQARFTIDLFASADSNELACNEVVVRDWVVVAEDGNKNFVAFEADDVFTLSPTTATP
jgi:hypothetical protein